MLRTLKILCILLKVLMLTRATIAVSSKDQKNHVPQDIPSFKFINVYNYVSNIESVQNYSDNVTVRNEVVLQESTISSEGTPSKPTFPRAFVEFGNKLFKKDIFVTFRWNKPELTNGEIQKYRIQYWFEHLNQRIKIVDIIPNTILQYKVYDLKPDTIYYFKVQAHNQFGGGPYTKFINVSTTQENPVPLLLVGVRKIFGVIVLDIDLQMSIELDTDYNKYKEIVYSALEHKIYGITETLELRTMDFNPNQIETNRRSIKIANLNDSARGLCIDLVARNLYWIQNSNIMKLDLTLWQSFDIVKNDNILKTNGFIFLDVLPSIGYLYWSELDLERNKNIIMQSDFDGKNVKPFLENNICFCQYKLLELSSLMQIDTTNVDKPLIYWILKNNLIVTDINGCKCNLILRVKNQTDFVYLTIDKINIYLYNNFDKIIYILKKKYALLESKENAFESVEKISMQGIDNVYHTLIALDKSLQLYPPTICLTPKMEDYGVESVRITANSIYVSLPESILNDGCKKYNLATTIYNISMSYLTCLYNNSKKFEQFNVVTYKRHYKIQNLTSNTTYTLKLALSNFYIDKLSMGLQFGSDLNVTTTPGKLNAPEDVTVQILTPTLAIVSWTPPKRLNNCVAVIYEVHCTQYPNSTEEKLGLASIVKQVIKPERTTEGKFFTVIRLLRSRRKYMIFVRVYPYYFTVTEFYTDSLNKTGSIMEPNNLTLSGVSTNSMNISWIPSVNLTIHTKFRSILEYKSDVIQEWQVANNTEWNNDKVTYYIENLLPRTLYKFRLTLRYPEYMDEDFIWSPNKGFTFGTLGDATKVPSAPGIPKITRLSDLMLNWEPAKAHNSQVTLYRLEGLIIENNYKEGNQTDKNKYWNLYYNGTDNYWILTRNMNRKYQFRVQAENVYGFGEWSDSSEIVDLTESIEISTMQYLSYLYNYLPLILSLVATVVICNVYYFYCSYRRRNKQVLSPINELATLYEMLHENVQLNSLYATPRMQYNPDKFALTIIGKKQITLTKFLGSGAFGKVFQGTVKGLEKSDTTPIAIKMLRKNASSQEKNEFLEEAKLMSHFRHKHVLRLLGICFDADSPRLILELMEAGDLLKYLRESRTLQPEDPHALRLQDLLAMCEDVVRGCCYLEELHFVHRDLACRNCLISARNRENRTVKIGDFGLARDIYKNNYYRMVNAIISTGYFFAL